MLKNKTKKTTTSTYNIPECQSGARTRVTVAMLSKGFDRVQNSVRAEETTSLCCSLCNNSFINNQPQALSHPLKLPDLNMVTLCNYLQPLLWYVCRLSTNVYVQVPLPVSRLAARWLEKIAFAFALNVSSAITPWLNWLQVEHSCWWGLDIF